MTGNTCTKRRRLVVAIDHHFVDVAGRLYTELAFGREYWQEYLQVFDEVYVFARVRTADEVPPCHFPADGPGIFFLRVPEYVGPYQLLLKAPAVLAKAWQAATMDAEFILRSGNVADCLWPLLLLHRRQYAREVQGMVRDAVREATRSTHPHLGPVFAFVGEALTKIQVRWASYTSYVSEACRKMYPSASRDREIVFSSVRLDESLIALPRSADQFANSPLRLVSVGRLEPEKGHHVLVDAVALLHRPAPGSVSLKIIGGGRELTALRQQVELLQLEDVVNIVGPVQYGQQLFRLLDEADLFVLPSLTEGMPRALIEAMGRGLPAIGSHTGGVPELLDPSQLVAPNSAAALADAIAARMGAPRRLQQESERNFNLAVTRYSKEQMRLRQQAFWLAIRDRHPLRAAA